MKARIEKEPRCVLVWKFGPESPGYGALELAARRFRLRLRPVSPAELGLTIGALCAGRHAPAAPAAPALLRDAVLLPAIVISGLSPRDGDLHQFLDEVRRGGAVIPLRAMVTPTSKDWTLEALLQELNAEHKALGGQP